MASPSDPDFIQPKQPNSGSDDASTAPEIPAGLSTDPPVQKTAPPQHLENVPAADFDADAAVDDITKQDSDDALKAQDEAAKTTAGTKSSFWNRSKNWARGLWTSPKKRYSLLTVLMILIALMAVPVTRYDILGLVFKSRVTVQAVDSKTGAPISGVTIRLGSKTVQTEADGKAVLSAHLGNKTLQANKQYYGGYNHAVSITFSGSHNHFKAPLAAMGRQVNITVVDKVSGKPIAGAAIMSQSAKTKVRGNGTAVVIIPSGAATQKATISAAGYNTTPVTIAANGTASQNTFRLTPAGKLYFLSNLSGKLDVVKTNLDGSDRQIVLAGTGSEDPAGTSLLASRDWKYLALLSKRSGDNASVYLIDTTNGDKLTTIDQGNASFSFVGWSGDHFVYQVTRGTVSDWQPNQVALKSLDAASGQTLLLDQTQASGTNAYDYVKQTLDFNYLIGNQLVYAKNWQAAAAGSGAMNGKQAELDSIGVDGSGHKIIKSFAQTNTNAWAAVSIITRLYEPSGLYIDFVNGGEDAYYDYDGGTVSSDNSLNANNFYQTPYATYLLSPSGNSTFWSEQRDGKNTLFTGDSDAKNQKQIATLSDYSTYGWYSDNYLLVSKNSSELYIMPAAGGTPLKITDYYKPAINYQGYGGGYGGL